MSKSNHASNSSAVGPAAGYYFQLRFGLLRGLQIFRKHPTSVISIETLDDISIAGEGLSIDSQLKHSIDGESKITKYSPALWRTLAIWIERLRSGVDEHHEFYFITASRVDEENPIHYLRPDASKVDLEAALAGLQIAASDSTNAATAKDRNLFLNAEEGERLSLLRKIHLADKSSNLELIANEIEEEIRYACEADQVGEFRRDLEGWWIGRVFDSWIKDAGAQIDLEELGAHVSYLKERYKLSNLPLDVPEQECEDLMEDSIFIKQIRAVTDSDRRLRNAQKAFLRAKIQRSKWIREYRIDPTELDNFDEDLKSRWEARHAGAVDELDANSTDDVVKNIGKSVLQWAEMSEVPIRSTRSVYMTSGSYHALADNVELGWHPNFLDLFGKSK